MSINKSQFSRVCALSKLSVDEKSFEAAADKINNILQFVDTMQAIDTERVMPLAHPLDVLQCLRPDVVTETGQREMVLSCAPSVLNFLYLVPQVISSL